MGGGEYLSDGITVDTLGLQLVMGKVVLSLRSSGGDVLTRGLNEVHRKINGRTLRNTYIHTYIHTYNGDYSGLKHYSPHHHDVEEIVPCIH